MWTARTRSVAFVVKMIRSNVYPFLLHCCLFVSETYEEKAAFWYARVPLHKLKPKGEDANNGRNQPESHVVTIGKRIQDARKQRIKHAKKQAKEDINEEDQILLDISPTDDSSSEEKSTLSSDSNSETLGVVFDAKSDVDDVDDHKMTREQTADIEAGDRLRVCVEVHEVVNEEQLEGAVGGIMEEECHPQEKDQGGYLKHDDNEILSDSSIGSLRDRKPFVKTRKKRNKRRNRMHLKMQRMKKDEKTHLKVKDQARIQWGQEESSDTESDGGWDFETGGMPLRPR